MKSRLLKSVVAVSLCIFLLAITGFQSAYAVDKSRVFIWLLFFSGIGSSTVGAVIQGQANLKYDEYMHTASQSEMESLIEDYDQKHQQSIIATRTGIGLTLGAIILSLIDAMSIPQPEIQKTPTIFGSEKQFNDGQIFGVNMQNGELRFHLENRF